MKSVKSIFSLIVEYDCSNGEEMVVFRIRTNWCRELELLKRKFGDSWINKLSKMLEYYTALAIYELLQEA